MSTSPCSDFILVQYSFLILDHLFSYLMYYLLLFLSFAIQAGYIYRMIMTIFNLTFLRAMSVQNAT